MISCTSGQRDYPFAPRAPTSRELTMNWKEDPRWAYVFVNLSCLMWASNIVLGRVLRGEIGPLTLTASRYVVASLLYVAVLGRSVGKEPLVRRDWVLLAAMGLTGIFGFSALLYRGLQFTTATNGVLINGSGPLMTAVLAAILLKERLSRRHVLGALISFLGVALIVGGGSFRALLQWHVNTGDLYILMAMVLWGVYVVISPTVTRSRSALSATALSTWMAIPFLLGATALEWYHRPPTWSAHLALAILYIGIFPSLGAFLAWNEGVRRVGPNRAMVFYNMLPVFGAILGVVLLGESLGWQHFFGGGLIIMSSLITIWPDLKGRVTKK